MNITIVEPSLQEVVSKAIELAKEGYELESVLMLGWSYELRMTKPEVETKTRAPRGSKNGNN